MYKADCAYSCIYIYGVYVYANVLCSKRYILCILHGVYVNVYVTVYTYIYMQVSVYMLLHLCAITCMCNYMCEYDCVLQTSFYLHRCVCMHICIIIKI